MVNRCVQLRALVASAAAAAILVGGVATADADYEENFEEAPVGVEASNPPDPPTCVIPADPLHSDSGMACLREWQEYIGYLQSNPDFSSLEFCNLFFKWTPACWILDERDIIVTMEFPEGMGSVDVYVDGKLHHDDEGYPVSVPSDCVDDECVVNVPTGFWAISKKPSLVLPWGTTFVIHPSEEDGYDSLELLVTPTWKEIIPLTGIGAPLIVHPSKNLRNTREELVVRFD